MVCQLEIKDKLHIATRQLLMANNYTKSIINCYSPAVGSSSMYSDSRSSSALFCLGVLGLAAGGPTEGLEVGV